MTIGEAIKRIEDPRLLVGKGQYVADLSIPGMLEAYVVRSPYAHARLQCHPERSEGPLAAASYKKSVVTVVTARDLPPNLHPIPMRLTPAPEGGGGRGGRGVSLPPPVPPPPPLRPCLRLRPYSMPCKCLSPATSFAT